MALSLDDENFQNDLDKLQAKNITLHLELENILNKLMKLSNDEIFKNSSLYEIREPSFHSHYEVGTLKIKCQSGIVWISVICYDDDENIFCASIIKP